MTTLHVLCTDNSDSVAQCAACLQEQDGLLLTGAGVYVGLTDMGALPCTVHVLDEDARAAGIAEQLDAAIVRVDMTGFVALTEQHTRQVSWA